MLRNFIWFCIVVLGWCKPSPDWKTRERYINDESLLVAATSNRNGDTEPEQKKAASLDANTNKHPLDTDIKKEIAESAKHINKQYSGSIACANCGDSLNGHHCVDSCCQYCCNDCGTQVCHCHDHLHRCCFQNQNNGKAADKSKGLKKNAANTDDAATQSEDTTKTEKEATDDDAKQSEDATKIKKEATVKEKEANLLDAYQDPAKQAAFNKGRKKAAAAIKAAKEENKVVEAINDLKEKAANAKDEEDANAKKEKAVDSTKEEAADDTKEEASDATIDKADTTTKEDIANNANEEEGHVTLQQTGDATNEQNPDIAQEETDDATTEQTADAGQQETADAINEQTADTAQQQPGDATNGQNADTAQQETGDAPKEQTAEEAAEEAAEEEAADLKAAEKDNHEALKDLGEKTANDTVKVKTAEELAEELKATSADTGSPYAPSDERADADKEAKPSGNERTNRVKTALDKLKFQTLMQRKRCDCCPKKGSNDERSTATHKADSVKSVVKEDEQAEGDDTDEDASESISDAIEAIKDQSTDIAMKKPCTTCGGPKRSRVLKGSAEKDSKVKATNNSEAKSHCCCGCHHHHHHHGCGCHHHGCGCHHHGCHHHCHCGCHHHHHHHHHHCCCSNNKNGNDNNSCCGNKAGSESGCGCAGNDENDEKEDDKE